MAASLEEVGEPKERPQRQGREQQQHQAEQCPGGSGADTGGVQEVAAGGRAYPGAGPPDGG